MNYFFLPFILFGSLSIKIDSPSACIINSDNGKVIYKKNINNKLYPASLTKIATALYIIEKCDFNENRVAICLSEPLKVITEKKKVESNFSLPPHLLENDGSTIYLVPGERVCEGDLIHALLIKSANDSANVLASLYHKSISEFMFGVNRFCRSIGCRNSHFINPHGLHHPNHYSTAHDLAIIMRRAIQNPYLRKIMSKREHTIGKTNKSPSRVLNTTNSLINPNSKYFDHSVITGKTGSHRRAKYNLAISSSKYDRNLVTIINKASSSSKRYDDCKKLIAAAYQEKKNRRILFKCDEVSFAHCYKWGNKYLDATLKSDFILEYYPSEEEEVTAKIHWHPIQTKIYKGDEVGVIEIYNESGDIISRSSIYADKYIGYNLAHKCIIIFKGLGSLLKNHPFIFFVFIIIFFFLKRFRVKKTV